jgi:hypothetical protein
MHICKCVCMYVCMYVCVYVCMYVHAVLRFFLVLSFLNVFVFVFVFVVGWVESKIVKRLVNAKQDTKQPSLVVLFVRLEGGNYCCLGRVQWVAIDVASSPIKIKWELLDFDQFSHLPHFKEIVSC